MKAIRCILIAVFVVVIWLPILQMNFHFYKEFDDMENRELAPPPVFHSGDPDRFPSDSENYLDDNFGFRPDFIRWNSILRVKLLGVSPIQSVILGKDSWLFYRSEALADGNTINDFRGTLPLSEAELARLQQRIEENARAFSRMNAVYLAVIAPNKNTLYSEFLPDSINRFQPVTRLDQLVEYLKVHSKVQIIDLRETFREAKGGYPLYWKTDSHWNTYGAHLGYRRIIEALSARFPGLRPAPIAGGKVRVKRALLGGDLAQMLFMRDYFPEDNDTVFELLPAPPGPQLKTLLFRHDSFGDNLYPFLRRNFEKIVNIAPFAPYRYNEINRLHPDVVLHVFAERYITQALHDDFYYREDQP